MNTINILQVGTPEFEALIREAATAGYEAAKLLFDKEQGEDKMYSRKEAMEKLNCGKTKLQLLITTGELDVTDTRPQHITAKSVQAYLNRKLRKW